MKVNVVIVGLFPRGCLILGIAALFFVFGSSLFQLQGVLCFAAWLLGCGLC
jgi:hypothetical protein